MENISLTYHPQDAGWDVAVLTITRPDQLNALNLATIAEIDQALTELATHKQVRALIVTGAGSKSFVAGADIKQLQGLDEAGAYQLSVNGNRVFAKLAALPFPTIAAINGFAFGGGCELALACDIRLASDNASFSLPEVALGVCPGWGGTQRMARLVGVGHAAELMFTAARIDANRAQAIGLVNSVYPQAELMDVATAMATKIGTGGPLAIAHTKKAMYQGLEGSLEAGLEIEAQAFSQLFNTQDAKNGLQAFVNKEKYAYQGN